MNATSPPTEGHGLRGIMELSYEVRRGQEAVRRAIRERKFQATKVGTTWVFDRQQWDAAVAYYRRLDLRREGRVDGQPPS